MILIGEFIQGQHPYL